MERASRRRVVVVVGGREAPRPREEAVRVDSRKLCALPGSLVASSHAAVARGYQRSRCTAASRPMPRARFARGAARSVTVSRVVPDRSVEARRSYRENNCSFVVWVIRIHLDNAARCGGGFCRNIPWPSAGMVSRRRGRRTDWSGGGRTLQFGDLLREAAAHRNDRPAARQACSGDRFRQKNSRGDSGLGWCGKSALRRVFVDRIRELP